MIRVSIIVPVFNGAATLPHALASLTAQTEGAFEALIVDDGSTDASASIAEEACRKDPRFHLIRLPNNKGVSAARNEGLRAARGTWVATLDADDWYEPQRLAHLLAEAERLNADAVVDNLRLFDHATGELYSQTHFGKKNAPTRLTPARFFANDTPFSRHALGYARPLARTAFLQSKLLCYDERFRLGEDFLFLAEIVLRGGRVFILSNAFYVHVHRTSPSTGRTSPFSRSNDDHAQIVRGSSILLARYNKLPFAARALLKRRVFLFQELVRARRLKILWQMKKRFSFARALLARPDAAFFGLLITALRWKRRRF